MKFQGKTVIVTGANRGIGAAIAAHFYDNGANVVMAVREPDKLLFPYGLVTSERILAIAVDVTKDEQLKTMVERSVEKFGAIDILINNAGVDQPQPLLEITQEHLDYIWNVNVKGLVMCTKYVAKEMVKRKSGKIINLSSIAGKEGTLYHVGYVSSKHAVIGITKCLARELIPYGITVNTVCPGLIETDMLRSFFEEYAKIVGTNAEEELHKMIQSTPRGCLGQPQDVAELVGFLCSEKSANIVGHAISTDGGILQH